MQGLVKSQPGAIKRIYDDQIKDFDIISDDIKDEDQKLPVTAALAKSAYYAGDIEKFSSLSLQVTERALKLFRKSVHDHPEKPADSQAGYLVLMDIVEFSLSHDIPSFFYVASQTDDPALKTHLFLYAAKGMAERIPEDLQYDARVHRK